MDKTIKFFKRYYDVIPKQNEDIICGINEVGVLEERENNV